MDETENQNLGTEHIDHKGRLNVPMTCFFDKPPNRPGWQVIWSRLTDDRKWPRVYIYKKERESNATQ